ncbi:hypothetical protein DFJ74DRAFT_661885 [Hyaloraphidium curvatum]|nr:hypothetical protein DFJ74DRAFT_661885 [Hyaloraphidium curvatum]
MVSDDRVRHGGGAARRFPVSPVTAALFLAVLYLLAFPPKESLVFPAPPAPAPPPPPLPPPPPPPIPPCPICPDCPPAKCPPPPACPAPPPEEPADADGFHPDFPHYLRETTAYYPLRAVAAEAPPAEHAFNDAVDMEKIPPGWLTARECAALLHLARHSSGPVLEIGAWRGRATSCIARGIVGGKRKLFVAVEEVAILGEGLGPPWVLKDLPGKGKKAKKPKERESGEPEKESSGAAKEGPEAGKDQAGAEHEQKPASSSGSDEPKPAAGSDAKPADVQSDKPPAAVSEPPVASEAANGSGPSDGAPPSTETPAHRLHRRASNVTYPPCATRYPRYSPFFPSCPPAIAAQYPLVFFPHPTNKSEILLRAPWGEEHGEREIWEREVRPVLELPGGPGTELRVNLALQNLKDAVVIASSAPDLEWGTVVLNSKLTPAYLRYHRALLEGFLRAHRATVFAFRGLAEKAGRKGRREVQGWEWNVTGEWEVGSLWVAEVYGGVAVGSKADGRGEGEVGAGDAGAEKVAKRG